MSLYDKIPVWDPAEKKKYSKVKSIFVNPVIKRPEFKPSILDGPVIRGVNPLLTKTEKLLQTKPKNRFEYERQFKRYHNKDWLKQFPAFEGW